MENAGTMYQILLCVIPKIPHVFPLPPPPIMSLCLGKFLYLYTIGVRHMPQDYLVGDGGEEKKTNLSSQPNLPVLQMKK